MDNSEQRPVRVPSGQLRAELRRLELARELSEETLTAITNTAEYVEFHAGQVVIEVDSEITHVCLIITGRMQATLYDSLGRAILKDTFVRGFPVGLFSLGLADFSHMRVQAIEPSTAIRLTLTQLLQLTAKHPDFQLAMFRTACNIHKRYLTVDHALPQPSVVGIVHHSEASRPLVDRVARRLCELGESPCVAGDDERWKPEGNIPYKLLAGERVSEERGKILKEWSSNRRFLVDIRADHPREAMSQFLGYVDVVLWCVRPQDANAAVHELQALQKSVPGWRDKFRIVWLLDNNAPFAPYVPELHELAARDFKLTLDAPAANQSRLLQLGVERIVHHLRGVQIGLALGGGAARGMAHLGVLKALEQHGIYVDMLAGTSAGAMTGTIYAAGFDPEAATGFFTADLKPSWFFRQLPGGGYWYLLYKYRRHHFDSMLRKYLGRARMEQLILPMLTVAVDLVEGKEVVREAGDATTSVLESINLPPLGLPILASDQALVDGGLLDNIPANLLVARGCNFVIASSVTAKIESDFMGIGSVARSRRRAVFATLQVLMRQNMIQHHSMNAVGVQPADFVIAPDVTSFDLSEFTRADEMARIGETTTNANAAKLLTMLNKLDSKLFESPAPDERLSAA